MDKFDLERFRDHFITVIKAGMAAKIAAINAEKNDGIVLVDFESGQYSSDLGEKVMNYDSFVLYGFPNITSNSNSIRNLALDVSMSFDVVIADPEGGSLAETKIMRYTRAITEIVQESTPNPYISDLNIEIFTPIPLQLSKTTPVVRMGGVLIKGSITA